MKLVVCFPGIGYHCDKPLLYYSRKLAACAGYDHTLLLQYTYHKDGLRGSPAALREAFDTLYAQAEAQLSAYVGDGETFVNVIPGTMSVETKIDYSIYDVNRDGVVNQLDLTRAQRHYGTDDEICDVDNNGTVDIADLILILNNYTK